MMILTEDPIVRCSGCGKEIKIPKEWFECDSYSIGEFEMGVRIQHDFICELECTKCGNPMTVTIRGYEYPACGYERQNSEAEGCEFIYEPAVEIDCYEFDIPDYVEDVIANRVDHIDELIDRLLLDRNSAYEMNWKDFEDVVARIFEENGFHVQVTQRAKDGGKDIIATFDMNGIPAILYIECKQYNRRRPVSVKIVREAYGTQVADHIGKAVIVTTSRFSPEAKAFAERQRGMIELIDLDGLISFARRRRR